MRRQLDLFVLLKDRTHFLNAIFKLNVTIFKRRLVYTVSLHRRDIEQHFDQINNACRCIIG